MLCEAFSSPIQTGIHRLDDFLRPIRSEKGGLFEWGCPHGTFGRVIPSLVAKSLGESFLWAYDDVGIEVYPNSLVDMGFDLSKFSFIKEENPIKKLKPLFNKKVHDVVVLDSKEFLNPSDLRFISNKGRQEGIFFFLLRPFYLSNKNGNPFCKYRINSSFNLKKKSFQLSFIKGSNKKFINIYLNEVFDG